MPKPLSNNALSSLVTSLAAALGYMVALSVLQSQHIVAGEPAVPPANPNAAGPSTAGTQRADATSKPVIASGRIIALRTTPLDLTSIAITDFGDHAEPAKSETR